MGGQEHTPEATWMQAGWGKDAGQLGCERALEDTDT